MNKVVFFTQKRVDGATRAGVYWNDDLVLESFENESPEYDPAIEWFVDVEFQTAFIPANIEDVRRWLIEKRPVVTLRIDELASELRAGIENGWPILRHYAFEGQAAGILLRGSTMRRLTAQNFAEILRSVDSTWESALASLKQHEEVLHL